MISPPSSAPPAAPLSVDAARWPLALLWAGVPLCTFGLVYYRLWEQWPSGRFGELLVISLLAWCLAWPLRRFAGWSAAAALALPWSLALVLFAGALPVLGTIVLGVTALSLGGILAVRQSPALQTALGLVLLGTFLSWLLPLPIHYRESYLLLAALLVLLRRRQVWSTVLGAREDARAAISAAPRASAWAVLALGLASTGCWLPTLQVDDLGYHLRLPWELLEQGRYAMDPETHMWALAPWLGDVLHAFVQVIAAEEARGPVNALWMLVTASGLWHLARTLGGDARARWSAIALYASLPLSAALAGSMQTETPTAALLVWLVVVIVDDEIRANRLYCGAVLVAGLLALKLAAAFAAIILLPWAAWRHRSCLARPRVALAVLAALALGGSSYLYAAIIAGNPFLPVLNAYFRSPYFAPGNFDDTRWHAGFDAMLPWHLTFDTGRYLEAFAGGGGFVLIALVGGWVLALLQRRTRLIAAMLTLSIAIPLVPLQYLRYAFPACVALLPLLSVVAWRADPRRAAWLLAGLCVLNFAFQANGHWMLRTGALKQTVLALGADAPLYAHYAPERILLAKLRNSSTSAGNVLGLDPDLAWTAEMGARARTTSPYDPSLFAAAAAANRSTDGAEWESLFRREGISEVILNSETLTEAQRAGLQRVDAQPRAEQGEAQWWTIPTEAKRP